MLEPSRDGEYMVMILRGYSEDNKGYAKYVEIQKGTVRISIQQKGTVKLCYPYGNIYNNIAEGQVKAGPLLMGHSKEVAYGTQIQ